MDFPKKCCQCYCCSMRACSVACQIDCWHAVEACWLAQLNCQACCWTLFAPLCIDCKLGDSGKAMERCATCVKYCIFGCALDIAGCCDGIYNCIKIIELVCAQGSEGVKSYADLTKNTEFIANKVKEALGLETGNEPLKTMGTFEP